MNQLNSLGANCADESYNSCPSSKRFKPRLMIAFGFLVMLLICCISIMVSCAAIDENNTNQNSLVDEPDIVKMTDDGFIIKLQPDGVTVAKTENGILSITKKQVFSDIVTPVDLITYDKYLVAIVKFGTIHTFVAFYDMEELNDGTDRLEPLRETIFLGNYHTSRVFEGRLYILSFSNNVYYAYNPENQKYEQTDAKDCIYDSIDGVQYFESLNPGSESRYGYLISMLDLNDIQGNDYVLSSYLESGIYDIYFSRHAMYIIVNMVSSRGCGYLEEFKLVKIGIDELNVAASSKLYNGRILSRYWIYENDGNLFVVYNNTYVGLRVFDENLKSKAALENLSGITYALSVHFDEQSCYLVTHESGTALKISLADASRPEPIGFSSVTASAGLTYEFGDQCFISIGSPAYLKLLVSYYDYSFGAPYLVNSIELRAAYTKAMTLKKAAFISEENNFFAFASEGGAHIFGIDEYGYLEERAFLQSTQTSLWEFSRVKLYEGVIYAISAEQITSYSLDTLEEIDTISTKLKD